MQIVREMAGYSWGRSDLVRRAMSKKKPDVMQREREYFNNGLEQDGQLSVPGALRLGVPHAVAERVFDQMTDFAQYAFPKAHAAAYAVVAYWTGWLKVHYPVEFMAALMNSMLGNTDKISGYIQYCRAHNIDVLGPDVNRSQARFSVQGQAIRFGLSAIKNVGHAAAQELITLRERDGAYADFFDFAQRAQEQTNKRMVESLIKAGSFDSLCATRIQALAVYEQVLDGVARTRRSNLQGQLSLFGDAQAAPAIHMELPDLREHDRRTLLAMEKEMTGVYISGHPLQEYNKELAAFEWTSADFVPDEQTGACRVRDGQNVVIAGIVTAKTMKATRKNDMMAFLTVEDLTGTVEVIVFPTVLQRYVELTGPDSIITVSGRVSLREEENGKLVADLIQPLQKTGGTSRLYLKYCADTCDFARRVVQTVLDAHPGAAEVLALDQKSGKKLRLGGGVRICDELLRDLRDVLGEDCVKTG